MHAQIEFRKKLWIAAFLICGLGFAAALFLHLHVLAGSLAVLCTLIAGLSIGGKPAAPGEVCRFGLIALLVFGGLFSLANWQGRDFLTGFFASFTLLGGLCAVAPQALVGLHTAWTVAAKAFGQAINVFFLTMAWFLVITPIALLKRLVSGRPLPLHPDKDAATYWIDRQEPAQPRERFAKRY